MLYLLFELGQERYALDVGRVVEVMPLVLLKQIPKSPPEMAGVFTYRGRPVPAIDMNQLTCGRPAERRLSTRIILVQYPGAGGEEHLLGLIAERVTETIRREPGDFVTSGVTNEAAPYLGPVATTSQGLIQRISVGKLLPPSTQRLLFKEA